MAKFMIQETTASGRESKTVRLGAGTGSSNNLTYKEIGKAVKLGAESRYIACVAGDPIKGFITSIDNATQDGYTTGGIQDERYKSVTFDGLQATPGTGTVAIGDYVVCGTVVAKDTAIAAGEFVRVCKATYQPNAAVVSTIPATNSAADIKTAIDAALVNVAAATNNAIFAWRVVSLGSVGTGAVGTNGVIERVAP